MNASARIRLRLRLRDGAAAAAFASIAASGSVPVWAIVGFGVGLLLSLAGVRVLSRRAGLAAAGLALTAALLFGGVLRGGLDLVVAACTFAALVTVHRMLSDPAPATDNQMHLTSLLMITGGAALSGELLFALFLALFSVLGSLSLALSVLDQASTSEDLPVRPLLRRVGVGALIAIIGAAVFFVGFPRLSWNVAARRIAPGLGAATTGFSDRVRLGGGGNIKSNPRAVLRATLSPDPGVKKLERYWLGRTFDTFTGREWLGSGKGGRPSPSVHLSASARGLIHQKIELLPAYDSRTAVALEPAVLISNATAQTRGGTLRASLVEVPGEEVHFNEPALAYTYHAYSHPPGKTPAELKAVEVERYLGLPASLDPKVRELARSIIGAEQDPLAAAAKVERFLGKGFRYSLELPGEVDDPVSHFLFERKEGHCEHFATALAVLLRSAGFPARVAAGFYGGERIGPSYVVRAGDAHAWAQVFVPGKGFVSFDATPDAGRAGRPLPILEWLTGVYEAIDAIWRARVLDYSLQDQMEFARGLVQPPRHNAKAARPLPTPRSWLGAALVSLAIYALWRARAFKSRPRPHPAASFAQALERAVLQARIPRREGEPLEELVQRLGRGQHPLSAPLAAATRRYLEARFGHRPLAPGEGEALLRPLRTGEQA